VCADSARPYSYPAGKAVLIVGFAIQIVSFSIFLVVAYLYRVRRFSLFPLVSSAFSVDSLFHCLPSLLRCWSEQRRAVNAGQGGSWTRLLTVLFIGAALVLIRSVYRIAEYADGSNSSGYLLTHEVFYYCLEVSFFCTTLLRIQAEC
jgi:hypothetical protein